MATCICTNSGCGKHYNPLENNDTACEYHPKGPIFHEGLKGWACCSKRVTEFEDFLKIPGCTVGPHSNVKRDNDIKTLKEAEIKAEVTKDDSGVEVYNMNPSSSTTSVNQMTTETPKKEEKPKIKEEDLNDPADAVIAVGTCCKRKTCGKKYVDESSREEECVFHPGEPIFHEGSKGWTCCSRKVLEFDEFLKIKGCKKGKHRFTDVAVDGEKKSEVVQCRHDWYQTQSSVIISIFAKKVDKTKTKVQFTENKLIVDIIFLDGKIFQYHTNLSQPIIPDQSKYEILSTKVEINLKKANGISWPTIEPNSNVVSWTTFGVEGSVGTVGSKKMYVAQDVAVNQIRG